MCNFSNSTHPSRSLFRPTRQENVPAKAVAPEGFKSLSLLRAASAGMWGKKLHTCPTSDHLVKAISVSMFLKPPQMFDKKIALAPGSATLFSMDLRQKCGGGDCWYRCPEEQMHHLKRPVLPDETKNFYFLGEIIILLYYWTLSNLLF